MAFYLIELNGEVESLCHPHYFAGPKLRGNLLIKESGNHQTHYLSLAPCQHLIPGSQGSLLRFYSTASGVTGESLLNGTQQVFVFKWLGQKFHRSCFIALTVIGISPWAVIKTIGI